MSGAVEKDGEVVFLHKMMDGPADKSYGIHVAKIAGLPSNFISKSCRYFAYIRNRGGCHHSVAFTSEPLEAIARPVTDTTASIEQEETQQLSLFSELSDAETAVISTLKQMNLLEMTPMDALNQLYKLKKPAVNQR